MSQHKAVLANLFTHVDESPKETAIDAVVAINRMIERKDLLEITHDDLIMIEVVAAIIEGYAK